jgi:hypothetical protein
MECGSAGYRRFAAIAGRQLCCRTPRRFAHFHAFWVPLAALETALKNALSFRAKQ